MVDRNARTRLAESLNLLVTGQMTNDGFDLVYDSLLPAPDRAVETIAEFGYGLYSDIPTYRLVGRNAVDQDTRETIERCCAFLRTELEYEWPDAPSDPWETLAGCFLYIFGLALGIALCVTAIMVWTSWPWGALLGVPGLALLLVRRWVLNKAARRDTPEWQAFYASGDWDAWPFLRQQDRTTTKVATVEN